MEAEEAHLNSHLLKDSCCFEIAKLAKHKHRLRSSFVKIAKHKHRLQISFVQTAKHKHRLTISFVEIANSKVKVINEQFKNKC